MKELGIELIKCLKALFVAFIDELIKSKKL